MNNKINKFFSLIILGLLLMTMVGCVTLTKDTTIEFTAFPKASYYQFIEGVKYNDVTYNDVETYLNQIKSEIKVRIDGENEYTLNSSEVDLNVYGLSSGDITSPGKHKITVILDTARVSFEYTVVEQVQATLVSTAQELQDALAQEKPIIRLTEDIVSNTNFNIRNEVTIYGDNHKITVENNSVKVRVLTLYGDNDEGSYPSLNGNSETHKKYVFYDLHIEGISTISDIRGIATYELSYADIVLDNCKIITNAYSINLGDYSNNLTVNIQNGSCSEGWAALNVRSSDCIINCSDSIFRSNNEQSGSSNCFATLVIDTGYNNIITFDKCQLEASRENLTLEQYILSIQYGAENNKIFFNNSVLNVIECNNQKSRVISNSHESNLIYVDSELVE